MAKALEALISSSSLSASAAFTSLSTINPQPLWRFVFRPPGSTPTRPTLRGALGSQPHLLVPAVTDGLLILGAERTEAAHEDRFLGGDDTVQAGNGGL